MKVPDKIYIQTNAGEAISSKWWEGYEEDSVGAVEYWMKIPKLKK